MSSASGVGQLIFYRLVYGAFTGTVAASVALIASVVPERRTGITLGMMQAAVFIGSSAGVFFGGLMADSFGYRASFRAGAALVIIGGFLVYYGTHENFTPENKARGRTWPDIKTLFTLKAFFAAAAVMFSVQFCNTLINPSFPLVVKQLYPRIQNINSMTGYIVAVSALAGALSSALFGHVVDKLGHKRILMICCAGTALASSGHFFAKTITELFLVRILFGLSIAGMLPAANALINTIINRNSIGKAYGIVTSISMLGIAFGPLAGGYIAAAAGLRAPFIAAAAAQILLGLLIIIFVKPGKHT